MRDIETLTRRTPLRFNTDLPDAAGQFRELIRDLDKFRVQGLILNALQDLVVAVQSTVKAVMRPAPQAFAEFGVVFAPLPGGGEEPQTRPTGTGPGRGPESQVPPASAGRPVAAGTWPVAVRRSPR